MAGEVTKARENNVSPLQVSNAVSQSTRNLVRIVSLINHAPSGSSISDWVDVANSLAERGEMTREDAELVSSYVTEKLIGYGK